ncbi:putative Acyl-CoA N-acyltransferase [Vibrio nigripulchritudo SFn27]|uniref:Putative Acyl-CoA N-acyltransferase n=1 Tax=Vibrio nigripulchritudo TaxID=28173 RepID=U4KE36_9VIBR|nr:GNAT family N-acetyltransferase [Vibrio nigripulchritudo]CCN35839.1 putative Acyl-CoA N-acyltransferase [Vibrio nigripulchritudo AM115]CCN39236.1 putative Acyl-CoA N-acyltransferase [Vibrio nigripulchritudo FTn2]CCN64894.1 putative Acyl-CoA N-acyltransferase [Vibrio nigripulchritudo POn4]CCN79184.1 putative Acyl-CoA N-acyltransferase [Vibrio nigripulchritudo SO65]CCN82279.1 putative Acyl-CoA N-acyltransferase [Vibrio nigripulchritudo BLFn1]
MRWKVCSFEQITNIELYQLLKLRVDIFIVEQNAPYSDLDGKDHAEGVLHVLGIEGDEVVAYARLLPEGLGYPVEVLPFLDGSEKETAIGRVVVKASHRGTGVGHELMRVSLNAMKEHGFSTPVFISAQSYLTDYYQQHGFTVFTPAYSEDGCDMRGMRSESLVV